MAGEALDTIGSVYGLVGDGIGLFGSIKDALFPKPPDTSFNNFRVSVGLIRRNDTEGDSRSTDGNAPALAAWDSAGNFLDQVTPDGVTSQKIANGGFRDYAIEGRSGATYLSVVRTGNDGICISMITGSAANSGVRNFAWTGDIGKFCGAPWYAQANVVSDNPLFLPSCIWIDGNADGNHIWKGFNLHLGSFPGDASGAMSKTADAWNTNRDLLCNSEPRFSMYEDIEIGNQIRMFNDQPGVNATVEGYADKVLGTNNWVWGEKPPIGKLPLNMNGKTPKIQCVEADCPPKGPSSNRNLPVLQTETRKRMRRRLDHQETVVEIKKRQALHTGRLVVSKYTQHSAIELCESLYSLGPDMVSVPESMFCDMSEKQLWPVCTDRAASYCFDMNTQSVRGSGTGQNNLPAGDTPIYKNSTNEMAAKPGIAATLLTSGSGSHILSYQTNHTAPSTHGVHHNDRIFASRAHQGSGLCLGLIVGFFGLCRVGSGGVLP